MSNEEFFKARVEGAIRYFIKSGKANPVSCLKQKFWADHFMASLPEESKKALSVIIAVSMDDAAADHAAYQTLLAETVAFYDKVAEDWKAGASIDAGISACEKE